MDEPHQVNVAGWREWVALPDIGIPSIEAKIDTGSKISTLHASFIEHYRRDGELWVRFGVNPLPDEEGKRLVCQAPVKRTEIIHVSDSCEDSLFMIEATLNVGTLQTPLDLVLKSQGNMKYMLHLGRNALQDLNIHVDPKSSYLFGDSLKEHYEQVPLQA